MSCFVQPAVWSPPKYSHYCHILTFKKLGPDFFWLEITKFKFQWNSKKWLNSFTVEDQGNPLNTSLCIKYLLIFLFGKSIKQIQRETNLIWSHTVNDCKDAKWSCDKKKKKKWSKIATKRPTWLNLDTKQRDIDTKGLNINTTTNKKLIHLLTM